jgi:hypothetical protein
MAMGVARERRKPEGWRGRHDLMQADALA